MVRLRNFDNVGVVFVLISTLSIILSFTNFYGISYILSIAILTLCLPAIRVFSSIFSRAILALLLLLSIAMIVGLFTWMAHVPLHPVFVVLTALLLAIVCKQHTTFKYRQVKYIDKIDILSVALALLAPAVIYLSFFAPKYTDSALYQFLSNGWDNSSHIAMLESTGLHKSYTSDLLPNDHNLDSFGSGYPQAWHLATSNFINGFGDWLNPDSPITVMRVYVLAMFVWFVISAYLITIIGYRLAVTSKQKLTTTGVATLALASLLLQPMTVLGALLLGFANFIGLLAYILVSIGILVSYERSDNHKTTPVLLMASLVAGVLCWFLPLPALLTTLLLFIIFIFKGSNENIWTFTKKNKITLLVIISITAIAVLLQLYIYLKHTTIGGAAQLNVAGGVYKNSALLVGIFTVMAAIYARKNLPKRIFNVFICLVLPIALVVGGLYIYQYISSGKLSYYYFKMLIVLTIIVGIFFIAAVARYSELLDRHITSRTLKIACSLGIILMAIVATGQTFPNEDFLLQRNSVVSPVVSEKIINYLEKGNFSQNKLVIFTDHKHENYNGELYTLVTYKPLTCAHQTVNVNSKGKPASTKPKDVIKRIDDCSRSTGLNISIVTNIDKVQSLVQDTNNDKLRVIRVKE